MSRRKEVEAKIKHMYEYDAFPDIPELARTLADEVDALRADLLALGKKATRYENEREINAGLVADRDAVITKLLAMLRPVDKEPQPEDCRPFNYDRWSKSVCEYRRRAKLHARACEIAGRKE